MSSARDERLLSNKRRCRRKSLTLRSGRKISCGRRKADLRGSSGVFRVDRWEPRAEGSSTWIRSRVGLGQVVLIALGGLVLRTSHHEQPVTHQTAVQPF
jgi:hypothetical protein